ncbi:ATP-binding protein, partial [Geomonas sp.]|uniref:ATP-binding protein n=1 Tax=Geomonas sp. TaxID=2651584 RepID=UPI002B4882C8
MKFSTFRFPIKTKLTVATMIPLAVAIFCCFLAGIVILNAKVAGQAQEKVRNDLSVAREAYQGDLSRVCDVVRFSASIGSTRQAIEAGNRKALAEVLDPVRSNEHLDIMAVVDASGRVVYRTNNPAVYGDQKTDRFVARALKGEVVTGSTVLSAGNLAREGAPLLEKARSAIGGDASDGGLFLMAAVPVRDPGGAVAGAIYGGVLLNNNHPVMERIRGVVYEGTRPKGIKIGCASVYLKGTRVASSSQSPAGAKLSEEVFRKVILEDGHWVGRVQVASEWYLAAYEPIRSLQGVPIGALYVGMPESQYSSAQGGTALLLGSVVLICTLIGVAFSGVLGSRLAQPIKELSILARRLAAGERGVRSNIDSRDEIGDLAGSFNEMSAALAEREERIIELNRDLEKKVELRTAELEEKNRLLVQTREELLRVEKLAAIGELAAGVAHEINNPMAIIRGNTELLQLALSDEDPNREEVDTIFAQVKRVERIVSNLLKFARRERREMGTVELNALLHEIISQVRHQEPLDGIKVQESYDQEVELVSGDGDQLRQVFTNLVINAVQAMPGGGVLGIESSRGPEGGGFQVRISDTGIGIKPENMHQIFNPFFTTKATGTGLGLSVSYGI